VCEIRVKKREEKKVIGFFWREKLLPEFTFVSSSHPLFSLCSNDKKLNKVVKRK